MSNYLKKILFSLLILVTPYMSTTSKAMEDVDYEGSSVKQSTNSQAVSVEDSKASWAVSLAKSVFQGACATSFYFFSSPANLMENKRFEDDIKQVDHHTVRKIVTDHLAAHPALLDSSKDKDIVVFLGNTGSGKSTLINYLSDKKLKANEFDEIFLEDPKDPSAMAIGGGSESETFLPAFVQVGNLLLYDFPGFKDTRGTAKNLVNACFIKRIIENARNTKLVFVAGLDQITTDRGASFKTLLSQAKRLVPNSNNPIKDFSSLVITKCRYSR